MTATPVTAEIARRATALAWTHLPDDLVERTKQCLLDWFAVTVPGAQEELTHIRSTTTTSTSPWAAIRR
jgi:2-methylcitrate dehydratase PrpD